MNKKELILEIYQDFFNIMDESTLIEHILTDSFIIQYIKNPSEKIKLFAVKNDGYSIQFFKNPSEKIQLEALKENVDAIQFVEKPSEILQYQLVQLKVVQNIDSIHYFMRHYFNKINCSKALNFLYNKVPEKYKDQIKFHPNYKSDAQLVLDKVQHENN